MKFVLIYERRTNRIKQQKKIRKHTQTLRFHLIMWNCLFDMKSYHPDIYSPSYHTIRPIRHLHEYICIRILVVPIDLSVQIFQVFVRETEKSKWAKCLTTKWFQCITYVHCTMCVCVLGVCDMRAAQSHTQRHNDKIA